jgi:pilus assembly protein CpaC
MPCHCGSQQDTSEFRDVARNHEEDTDIAALPDSAQEIPARESIRRTATNAELLREKEAQLATLREEVNQLRNETERPQHILVNVKMVEVSRTMLRKMGTDIALDSGPLYQASDITDLQKITRSASDQNALKGFIDFLCQNQIAKVLAEPNIIVADGRSAQFCIGGEVPIPARGDSEAAVEFQKFGTEVNVLACTTGSDRARLNIRTRVSELDGSHNLTIGNAVVPAFRVRELDTAIDSKFGQSTLLCGGTENRKEAVQRVGKDGNWETVDENNEIALLVIVTPEAVGPIHRSAQAPTIKK